MWDLMHECTTLDISVAKSAVVSPKRYLFRRRREYLQHRQQRSEIALSILTKVFRDIEILVLVDRDLASGKTTDANDREIYLKHNPDNHRVLVRWELENYLYDEDPCYKYIVLITDSCLIKHVMKNTLQTLSMTTLRTKRE